MTRLPSLQCLLISDLHFEEIKEFSLRIKTIESFCTHLTNYCRIHAIQNLFIAGDISVYLRDLELFFSLISQMEKLQIFFVPGNHEIHINFHSDVEQLTESWHFLDIAFQSQEDLPDDNQLWRYDGYSKYLKIRELAMKYEIHFLHDIPHYIKMGKEKSDKSKWAAIGNMGWYNYDLFHLQGIAVDAYDHYYQTLHEKYEWLFYKPPENEKEGEFQSKILQYGINAPIIEPNLILHDYFIALFKLQLEILKVKKVKNVLLLTHLIPVRKFIPLKDFDNADEDILDQLDKNKYKLYYPQVEELIAQQGFDNVIYLCGHTHFQRSSMNPIFLQNPCKITELMSDLSTSKLKEYFSKGEFKIS